MNGLSCQKGTSLLDLLSAFIIMAIAAAIAIPNFNELRHAFDRMNARSSLLEDLKRAQAKSITEGCRGIVTINDAGTAYSYGCDYLDYDVNDPPAYDTKSFERNFPNGITLTASDTIIFNSRGEAVDLNGIITNNVLTLLDSITGEPEEFAIGTLLGTGVFSYEVQ